MIEVLKPTLENAEDCMGCEACINVCPVDALSIQCDELGFRYPKLDSDKCIDCGRCNRVCPALTSGERPVEAPISVYAMRNRDISIVDKSRSGGIFTALSDKILSNDGAVSGAIVKPDFLVSHIVANSQKNRNLMRGSKYVQSRIDLVFRDILQLLKSGKTVMFTGTPCQVYGLKRIVPEKYADNLVTVDVICHGVCSPAAWNGFLKYISKREGDTIISVNFRDKEMAGWDSHRESFVFKHKGKVIAPFAFYNDVWLRKSCYKCPFASVSRMGDITLGDLWNWQAVVSKMNEDNRGISSIFVNTSIGRELIDRIKGNVNAVQLTISEALQPNLLHPTKKPNNADKIRRIFEKKGYMRAAYRLGLIGWRKELKVQKFRLKKILKR